MFALRSTSTSKVIFQWDSEGHKLKINSIGMKAPPTNTHVAWKEKNLKNHKVKLYLMQMCYCVTNDMANLWEKLLATKTLTIFRQPKGHKVNYQIGWGIP